MSRPKSINFPGGRVYITKTSDGATWVHIDRGQHEEAGKILDARVDQEGKHSSDCRAIAAPLCDPSTYHVALKIAPA